MKIASIMWPSYMPALVDAARKIDGLELRLCSMRDIEETTYRAEFFSYLRQEADVIVLHPSTNAVWEEMSSEIAEISKVIPTIVFGYDPALLAYNTVPVPVALTVQQYVTNGGEENSKNALLYILNEVLQQKYTVAPPEEIPWQGIFYPGKKELMNSAAEYKATCPGYQAGRPTVGVLFYRNIWLNNNHEIAECLVDVLDALGLNTLLVFGTGGRDVETGAEDNIFIIEHYFMEQGQPIIDVLLDIQSFFFLRQREHEGTTLPKGYELLQKLNVPIIKALMAYGKTEAEWRADNYGISGPTLAMSVGMPECDGIIEPTVIACQERVLQSDTGGTLERYRPVVARVQYLCKRVKKWIDLKNKPVAQRKVAIILHNNPCTGTELSVGGGANLDTLESVARILARMQGEGYTLRDLPASGEELIHTIMERKAISDFRWTPIEEIVAKGGVLEYLKTKQYRQWFDTFPLGVQQAMIETWGNPPGEEIDEVPAAMVYNGDILITGVEYGHAVICAQPKRGCAGARCDGKVCKILHDPECPPTHQYVATYRFLEEVWGADVIVHVGTHGNLEFLPGKAVGLSESCYPEITLGTMPHLYIYNTDNPPEGTIAKRRGQATLIGHMQTVLVETASYGILTELENMLGEYQQARVQDKFKAHALEHLITEKITEANLTEEIDLTLAFDKVLEKTHAVLSRLKNTMHPDGMHIFDDVPVGERRVELIHSILRHDVEGQTSLGRLVAEILGLDYDELHNVPHLWHETLGKTYGDLLQEVHTLTKALISEFLAAEECGKIVQRVIGEQRIKSDKVEELAVWQMKTQVIDAKLTASREMDSLLHGFTGGYISAGPSGLITRGRTDILPTGRNFYSADPERIPTQAAWRTGRKLAVALLARHQQDTGKLPENCAMILFANDCMWTDGEQVSQILFLLGVEPHWVSGGKVKGFRIIPLEELGRPRIDVTVRIGLVRDCFPGIVDYIDDAVRAVAELDEPIEENYVRKHTLDNLEASGQDWEKATARIFGSRPHTYGAGVNLAVYASAWKTEQDLSDVFIHWTGYAYGKNRNGQEARPQLESQMKTVDVTFHKTATDEYDLLNCCGYYSSYGGMTLAARTLSGKEVQTYYGDTRDPERAQVTSLAEEINRVVRTKVLNPAWIEGMQRHGYKGAGDMAKRIGRVYGWEATTGAVADWVFDDIARTYVLDEKMRKWFEEQSPWALEEINRRLLEAEQRGLWKADPEILEGIKETYLEIEGWMEERMGEVEGEFQGGAIDIITMADVPAWQAKMGK